MTLKTSLLITGDSKVAQKAVEDLAKSVEALGTAGKGAATGVATVGAAEAEAAAAARAFGAVLGEANAAIREMGATAKATQAALLGVSTASTGAAGAMDAAARAARTHSQAVNDNAVAHEGLAGKAGIVGGILSSTGIWGSAVSFGIGLLTGFAQGLLNSATGADKEADALGTLASATDELDRLTGRLNKTKQQEISLSEEATRKHLAEAIATRTLLQAELERANKQRDQGSDSEGGLAFGVSAGAGIEGQLARNAAEIKKAQDALTGADFAGAVDRATASTNKSVAANTAYDASLKKIRANYEASGKTAKDLALAQTAIAAAQQRRDAATKTANASADTGLAADARLASAADDISRAQANLAKVTRDATAAEKAGTITREEAVRRIAAAQTAVDKAKDAVKAHRLELQEQRKATSDAAAENRRLDSTLASIVTKYAALTEGGKGYAKTLGDLAELTAKGKIDPFQSAVLTGAVFADQNKAQQQALTQAGNTYFTAGGETPEQQIRAIVDKIDRAADVAGQTFEDHVLDAAKGVSGALQKASSVLSEWFPGVGSSSIGRTVQSADKLASLLGKEGDKQQQDLSKSLQSIAEKGLGLSDDGARKFGEIGGKAIKGAAEGALANSVFEPIAGALGIKTSKTGAQIGGAIGSALPIPGGSIIGSIAGSIFGGLFKGVSSGYAQIRGSGDTAATIAGTYGTKSGVQSNARTLAGGVLSAVEQLASSLGGRAGGFNLDIGQKDDKFVVNTADHGGGKSDTYSFSTEEEALNFAVKNAVSDGAILGISAAMKRALEANSDIDTGVSEALKVKQVEATIADLGDTLKAQFTAFDTAAADAVAVAQKYGLDVLALEKKNGEDRVKLAEQLLKAQVGSLQSLVTELTSGDLFEGNYADKIAALNQEIDKAKADLDAGVDGAADTLADLYKQRLAASKDAYGTTGAYAADRNSTIAEAQAAIAAANAKITAAQNATSSDPALATTNAALDENNDQNAQIIVELRAQNAQLAAILNGMASSSGFNLSELAVA